jgi:C-22 sterol desaturase
VRSSLQNRDPSIKLTSTSSIYLRTQERIYQEYFSKWLSDPDPNPKPYQMEFRDLNMITSLRVFCGDFIPEDAVQEISHKYWLITSALELVNFPLALPGTKIYNAIQARKVAMAWFEKVAADSKRRMAAGEEPKCLTDAWVKEMIEAREYHAAGGAANVGEKPSVLIRDYSDREIAMVVMTFLFVYSFTRLLAVLGAHFI